MSEMKTVEVRGRLYEVIRDYGWQKTRNRFEVLLRIGDRQRKAVRIEDTMDWHWVSMSTGDELEQEEKSKEELEPKIKVYGVEYTVIGGMERNPEDDSITILVDKGNDEEGRQLVQLAMHNNITGGWEWHGPVEEQVPDILPIKRTISVWEPGSMVKLVDELEGRIRAVQIRMDGSVVYEIAWWKDHNRSIAWMNEGEFKVVESGDKCQIGFVKEE